MKPLPSPQHRVLMLGWEFPPLVNGGLGVACHGLAHALSPHVDLTLILPQKTQTPGLPQLSLKDSLSPYLDASGSLYGPDLETKVAHYAEESALAATGLDFDLIHAHDWMTASAGLKIRAQTHKPLVFHVHSLSYDRSGPDDRGSIYEVEKSILQQADLVITVSHYTREICIQHYGANPDRIAVVHNGANPIRAYRSPKPFPEKLVVFLGRLTGQKGPDHFLEIARKVLEKDQNVRFAVAGTGEQLHALMAKTIRLGIRSHFHFTGFLNRKKVHDLLSMGDVYCMPSVSEPFGLSALEAAQFGLPAVLSDQSGVSEILTDAKTADTSDTRQLAQHLNDLLGQTHQKRPQVVRSWQDAATEILGHYDQLT